MGSREPANGLRGPPVTPGKATRRGADARHGNDQPTASEREGLPRLMILYTKPRDLVDGAAQPSSQAVARVYVTAGRFDAGRGQRFNAHLGSPDGEPLVVNALDVEYAACRALQAHGVTGPAEMWRPDAAHPDTLVADIGRTAELTVYDSATSGVRVVKFRTWSEAMVSPGRDQQDGEGVGEEGVEPAVASSPTQSASGAEHHLMAPSKWVNSCAD